MGRTIFALAFAAMAGAAAAFAGSGSNADKACGTANASKNPSLR